MSKQETMFSETDPTRIEVGLKIHDPQKGRPQEPKKRGKLAVAERLQQKINRTKTQTTGLSGAGNTWVDNWLTDSDFMKECKRLEVTDPIAEIVNLDWLELSFECENLIDGVEHQFYKDEHTLSLIKECENRCFLNVYSVYINGALIGELKTMPKQIHIMTEKYAIFKMVNSELYTKGWAVRLKLMVKVLGLTFKKVHQFDIAADGVGFLKINDLLSNNQIYNCGAENYDLKHRGRQIPTLYIGSRASDKFIRIYDKRKELLASNKKYIESFWLNNGLQTEIKERCELVLKGKHSEKLFKNKNFLEVLAVLVDQRKIAEVMANYINRMMDFKSKNEGGKNHSRKNKLFKIDFTKIVKFVKPLDVIIKAFSNGTYKAKMAVRFFHELGHKTGIKHFLNFCDEITENIYHSEWYERRKNLWVKDYERKKSRRIPWLQIFDLKAESTNIKPADLFEKMKLVPTQLHDHLTKLHFNEICKRKRLGI